jgi:hypothetical protein
MIEILDTHFDMVCYQDYKPSTESTLTILEEAGMKPPRYTKLSESNEVEAFEGWEPEDVASKEDSNG